MQYLESWIYGVESRIQYFLGFSYTGLKRREKRNKKRISRQRIKTDNRNLIEKFLLVRRPRSTLVKEEV